MTCLIAACSEADAEADELLLAALDVLATDEDSAGLLEATGWDWEEGAVWVWLEPQAAKAKIDAAVKPEIINFLEIAIVFSFFFCLYCTKAGLWRSIYKLVK